MSNIYDDNSMTIGNTPLVRLSGLTEHNVLAKIEGVNPANCVKCRIGANMIWDAEKRGVLKPGMEIIEPTSGNTGIALAFVAAARGYKLTLTMPASMSLERRKVVKALGANLVLTEAAKGMPGAIDKAHELEAMKKGEAVLLQQFENPANPAIHESTTGPEIWQDTDGDVDILVAGVGTGGTITGCSRYLKKHATKPFQSIAVEPEDSPVISQALSGQDLKPGPHKIQGIGAGFIPKNLDLDLIDGVEQVSNDDAVATARLLMQKCGILAGISSGASVCAALRVAEKPENKGKTIVAIVPDSGERYLSSVLFDGIFTDTEMVQ